MRHSNNIKFEILPTEILQTIISYLPYSQRTKLTKVSKKLRLLVTQHLIWKRILTNANLLERVPTHFTPFQIILFKYSKYICEYCGKYCAREQGSNINLPVIIEQFDMIISLCLNCRVYHYINYPEQLKSTKHLLPMYSAMIEYALTEKDLNKLTCTYEDTLVKHYKQEQVIQLARTLHGGDIGITRALMCSLNLFRPTIQHTYTSCSREHARKKLIILKAKKYQLNINYNSTIYQDFILTGIGSVNATLDSFKTTLSII